MTQPDPMTFMYAAVESVRKGDVGEIEMDWDEETDEDRQIRFSITVRKEPRNFFREAQTPEGD